MKAAIKTLAWRFSTRRMVKEYTTRLYLPAAAWGAKFRQPDYRRAKELAAWLDRLLMAWPRINIAVDAPRETPSTAMRCASSALTIPAPKPLLWPVTMALMVIFDPLNEYGFRLELHTVALRHTQLFDMAVPGLHVFQPHFAMY